ncbi:MAG: Mov34/MPN/PAD-1 family protein, partial [Anaerolineales bacterium]|nr:Mov34/MPN/PAD-1 family protein [Anaerolineales bacterium]
MYEFNELTYAAILTIYVPGTEEPLQAHVTLAPPDSIETPTGSKLLRDCTIADLHQFAQQLEQDVWQTQGQITLYDLTTQEDALVKLVVINEENEQIAPGEDWLHASRLVIHTPLAEASPTPEPSAETNSNDEPVAEAPTTANESDESAEIVEDIPIVDLTETPTAPPPPVPTSPDGSPQIRVAESEPIHPEREAERTPAEKAMLRVRRSDLQNRTAGQKLRPFSRSNTAVDVLFDEIPFREAQAHANTSLNREVAGVLVGPHPEKQPDGRYVVHVTDVIIAKHTKMQGASVTYTPESWRYVNDVMMERYPEEECVIVGWYHTHPGFGIFLSNMDLFIHHNFFTQKWHIAL